MPFPSSNIDFLLVKADPTVLHARNLRTQLNALGYTCPLTGEAIRAKITALKKSGKYPDFIPSCRKKMKKPLFLTDFYRFCLTKEKRHDTIIEMIYKENENEIFKGF
jgi:hypothetical protein